MNKKTLDFVTYCVGKFSALLKLPQKEAYRRLEGSSLLYGCIVPLYDVPHTLSFRYLTEDLKIHEGEGSVGHMKLQAENDDNRRDTDSQRIADIRL